MNGAHYPTEKIDRMLPLAMHYPAMQKTSIGGVKTRGFVTPSMQENFL